MEAKRIINKLKLTVRKRSDGKLELAESEQPAKTGLASGLTPQAIRVFELAKKQQQEQAKVD